MTAETVIAHLTDLHLGDPARDPALRADTFANLRAALREIRTASRRPDLVAISGDLANHGEPESYRRLRDEMAALGLPVVCALGNHDARAAFRAEMQVEDGSPDAPFDHDEVQAGVHVIALDTSAPGRIGGALEREQLAFLDAALGRRPDLPKLLMIHHPPALATDPSDEWERLGDDDGRRLGDLVEGRGVVGVLSGHVHQDRVAMWRGAPLVSCVGLHCEISGTPDQAEIALTRGASFATWTLRGGAPSIRFAQLPSDRAELGRISRADLRAIDAAGRSA